MSEKTDRGTSAGLLTAVIDIGKTHTRLILLDERGDLVRHLSNQSASIGSSLGYAALDTDGTEAWLRHALARLGNDATFVRRVIVTTHGAAIAALKGEQLCLPVPDYEWSGFDWRSPDFSHEIDVFTETLSPVLPRGLNMGVQLDWLSHHASEQFRGADTLMPYAQYWAWWLTGVKASEISSLGCHSLLWRPQSHAFSQWAEQRGWASLFPRMRKAWEVLGTLRKDLADEFGLPHSVLVHAGVHDSNACLAHYLRSWPRMTLITTGTWVVVMAPGAPMRGLEEGLDQLGNVSVRGDCVPTARFMGGREIHHLCMGADPALADVALIPILVNRQVLITPSFESQGGPFAQRRGERRIGERVLSDEEWGTELSAAERATAAAIYAAEMIAWTIVKLNASGPIVLEGPLAHNEVVVQTLAAALPRFEIYIGDESVEGTARGSWCLTHWVDPVMVMPKVRAAKRDVQLSSPLRTHWDDWQDAVRKAPAEAIG